MDFFLQLNLLPPYSLRSQGDNKKIKELSHVKTSSEIVDFKEKNNWTNVLFSDGFMYSLMYCHKKLDFNRLDVVYFDQLLGAGHTLNLND